MTVSSTTSRNVYNGNGVTTSFTYNFRLLDQTHIKVYVDGVLKTLTTHYTVTGVGGTSGNIVFITAPPSGTNNVLLIRSVPLLQETDYVENDAFPAETHEAALDKLTMIAQQQQEELNRTLQLPVTSTLTDLEIPTPDALKLLRWNSGETALENVAAADVSAAVVASIAAAAASASAASTSATSAASSATTASTAATNAATSAADAATSAASVGFTLSSTSTFSNKTILASGSNIVEANVGIVNEFRLTLSTGVPVTISDVTGATTLYCTPYLGNRISLYDGTRWNIRSSSQFSIALGTLTSGLPYDVFCYDNAGVPTLELLAWTNDTTRATALDTQNGILVKTGATTRRYLGTFYTTSTTATEDSVSKRYLWNYYNRIEKQMKAVETTDNWNYTTATLRQANGSSANQLNFILGVSENAVIATAMHSAYNTNTGVSIITAIGLDSTSAKSADCLSQQGVITLANNESVVSASYVGHPVAGRHFLAWLEYSSATGTTTWKGDNGGAIVQSGIVGRVHC